MHRLLVIGVEPALDEKFLGLQPDQGKRRLELMGGFGGEAANLLERSLQAIEHEIQQQRQIGNLIAYVCDRNTFAQIVGADAARGFANQAHRAHGEAAQAKTDCNAHRHHSRQEPDADTAVGAHGLADTAEGRRDGHIERTENELAGAQFADSRQNRVVLALARDVGDRQTPQVARVKHRTDGSGTIVDRDVKKHGGVVGGFADPRVDGPPVQGPVVASEMSADLGELGAVQQIETVHQVDLQEVIAGHESTHQHCSRGARVPEGEPGADRSHNN